MPWVVSCNLAKFTKLLFPLREFPVESCWPLKMRLYLRHGLRSRGSGCNYKIHNDEEESRRVRATLLNSKKLEEDALYRGITTTPSANGKWRRVSPINILLANGGAKRRAERIVMHESCGGAGTHAIPMMILHNQDLQRLIKDFNISKQNCLRFKT